MYVPSNQIRSVERQHTCSKAHSARTTSANSDLPKKTFAICYHVRVTPRLLSCMFSFVSSHGDESSSYRLPEVQHSERDLHLDIHFGHLRLSTSTMLQ